MATDTNMCTLSVLSKLLPDLIFGVEPDYGVVGLHHVGILCENLEMSMAFYKDLLGELAVCFIRCILMRAKNVWRIEEGKTL